MNDYRDTADFIACKSANSSLKAERHWWRFLAGEWTSLCGLKHGGYVLVDSDKPNCLICNVQKPFPPFSLAGTIVMVPAVSEWRKPSAENAGNNLWDDVYSVFLRIQEQMLSGHIITPTTPDAWMVALISEMGGLADEVPSTVEYSERLTALCAWVFAMVTWYNTQDVV